MAKRAAFIAENKKRRDRKGKASREEKMKKERIALLAAVLALGMIFAGCGKKDNGDVTQYCTVTFIMPDGTKETRRVKKGESLTDYPELKIEGYTATWDGEFSNIDEDRVISKYTKTANKYTVTYVTDDGVSLPGGVKETLTVTYDATYTLAVPNVPDGKYFWYWHYGEEKTPVNPQGTWKIAKNVSLSARCEDRMQNKFMVKFIGANGTEPIVRWVSAGEDYTEDMPALPEIEGYDVTWSKGKDVLKNITADIEVTLVTTPKTYTVTLDISTLKGATLDGGTSLTATYGKALTVPVPSVPKNSDYEFVGWKIKDKDLIFTSGTAYGYTEDITLVAQWKETDGSWTDFY